MRLWNYERVPGKQFKKESIEGEDATHETSVFIRLFKYGVEEVFVVHSKVPKNFKRKKNQSEVVLNVNLERILVKFRHKQQALMSLKLSS